LLLLWLLKVISVSELNTVSSENESGRTKNPERRNASDGKRLEVVVSKEIHRFWIRSCGCLGVSQVAGVDGRRASCLLPDKKIRLQIIAGFISDGCAIQLNRA